MLEASHLVPYIYVRRLLLNGVFLGIARLRVIGIGTCASTISDRYTRCASSR